MRISFDFFDICFIIRAYKKQGVDVMNEIELAKLAHQAKKNAYTPYYNFRVGAALLCDNGKVFTGCNIENAAGVGICAERVAIAKAISDGEKNFVAIAIAGDGEDFLYPCGVCRQYMIEFSTDMIVINQNKDGEIRQIPLHELLPHHFGPSSL